MRRVDRRIIIDWTYEKTGCIWLPALFHGAFNAIATVTIAVCATGTGSLRLLGPAPNGLLAGIPFFAVALILFLKRNGPAGIEESDRDETDN